ncbi:MAG TPA: hypothetical protein VKR58_06765 [Aquella sp.]|nr:hypothetical protein [Aquella sp.]
MNIGYAKDKAAKKVNLFLIAIIMLMSLSTLFADNCLQSGNKVDRQTTTYVDADGHVVPIVTATYSSGNCKDSSKNSTNSSVNLKSQEKPKKNN